MVAFTSYEIGKHPEQMKLDKLYVRYDVMDDYVMSKLLAGT